MNIRLIQRVYKAYIDRGKGFFLPEKSLFREKKSRTRPRQVRREEGAKYLQLGIADYGGKSFLCKFKPSN